MAAKRDKPAAGPVQIMLRDRDVAIMAGVCQASVWNGVRDGWLPKPYRLGPRITRWNRDEVEAALTARRRQKDQEAPIADAAD